MDLADKKDETEVRDAARATAVSFEAVDQKDLAAIVDQVIIAKVVVQANVTTAGDEGRMVLAETTARLTVARGAVQVNEATDEVQGHLVQVPTAALAIAATVVVRVNVDRANVVLEMVADPVGLRGQAKTTDPMAGGRQSPNSSKSSTRITIARFPQMNWPKPTIF